MAQGEGRIRQKGAAHASAFSVMGGISGGADQLRDQTSWLVRMPLLLIPFKVVSDSDLIPVAGSNGKPVVFGVKQRRSFGSFRLSDDRMAAAGAMLFAILIHAADGSGLRAD